MGTPSRYSLDVPSRALCLLNALWDGAEATYFPGEEHAGPLTTTFLLGMATPIITLPIERIERHRGKEDKAYLNERPLDKEVASEVDRTLAQGTLGSAYFFNAGDWRFASIPYRGENLAMHFPQGLRDQLTHPDALGSAEGMPASMWTSCIRNSLAHGGVLYLDGEGRHEHGQRAEMLAFVSAVYPKFSVGEHPKGTPFFGMRDTRMPPDALRVLSITEKGFLSFLQRWVEWVEKSGLARPQSL